MQINEIGNRFFTFMPLSTAGESSVDFCLHEGVHKDQFLHVDERLLKCALLACHSEDVFSSECQALYDKLRHKFLPNDGIPPKMY